MKSYSTPKAFHSVLWAVAQSWGGKAIVFILFVLLARILTPAEFGIASASATILLLITLVADFGFSDAIVQRRSIADFEINLPFYFSVALCCLLSAVVFIYADKLEALLRVNGLAKVLSISALIAPLASVSLFQEALYKRHLAFKQLALRVFAANTIAGVVSWIAAINGAGVWSLVIQAFLATFISVLWLWARPFWKPTTTLDFKSFRDLVRFGSNIVSTRILDFGASRIVDFVIVAKYGVAALGLYAAGSRIYSTLMQLLQNALSDVALSLLSKLAHDKTRVADLYIKTSILSCYFGAAGFAAAALMSNELCFLLFGAKWTGVGEIAQPLLMLGSVQCVQFLNGPYLSALGRPSAVLKLNILKISSVLLTLTFFNAASAIDMVRAFALCQIITTPLSFWMVCRELDLKLSVVVKNLAPIFIAIVCSFVVAKLTADFVLPNHDEPFLKMVVLGFCYLVSYLIFSRLLAQRQMQVAIGFLISKIKK